MTLLVALHKLRHPIVVEELQKNTGSWYTLGSMKNTSFRLVDEADKFYLEYSTGHRNSLYRKYFINLGRESFSLRITELQPSAAQNTEKELASINDIPYNNDEAEAMLFQFSLSNELRQFGINEYNAVSVLRKNLLG